MYPPTPFHSNPKQHFMETVSTLFDSVDSSRNLKFTLEEQIRKSAQLLQTLQSSGTMIENLVRGQFKELEKGVIERFEGEIEHLSARVRQLEEHQGLAPPPRKPRTNTSVAPPASNSTPPSSAMTGVTLTSTGSSAASAAPANDSSKDRSPASSSPSSGTLPTPPLTKAQDSAMEIEQDEAQDGTEYQSSVQKLQERIETLEED
jgi:polyhydroxyalkanoate synthesis regulator phasin